MMKRLVEFARQCAFLLRRGKHERELDEEMRHHLELKAQEHEAEGLAPGEARRAALREFGNPLLLREEGRQVWGWAWLETLLQDLRYGLRQLRRNPGFTAAAVATLALGIGANTLIFSVVNAAILHPLPFRDSSGILTLWTSDPAHGYSGPGTICDPDYHEWKTQNNSLAQVAGFRGETANLTGVGEPVRLQGAEVSASLFPLLGVNAIKGGVFSTANEQPDRNRVVLLSDALWRSRFASNPKVIGKPVKLDGEYFTVVGVMPAGFDFPDQTKYWTPLKLAGDCHNSSLQLLARRRPGISLSRARNDAAVITARLTQRRHPDDDRKMTLVPLEDEAAPDIRTSLLVLLGAVGLVLLIACANVANLKLSRTASRQRETAVRAALGANRARIVRQMLTESAMLAILGGGLGLILAEAGHHVLAASAFLLPASFVTPGVELRIVAAGIDPWVLGFTFAVALVTGILFGLVPALQASRPDLNDTLKEGGRGLPAGAGRGRFRDALAAAEIALALILLAGSGLLIRSFLKLASVDPGFRPQGVLTMNVNLPNFGYNTPEEMIAFERQAVARLEGLPGVRAAGVIFGLPLGDMRIVGDYTVEDRPTFEPAAAVKEVVGGGYFRAMGIPLQQGRFFNEHDSESAQRVVIVNETFARLFGPHRGALGKRLKPGFAPDAWCSVVGVVGDAKQSALNEAFAPAIYLPYAQAPIDVFMRNITFVVAARGDPLRIAPAARAAVQAVDPNLPVFDVASMEELVSRSVSGPRFNSLMLGGFAALALLLAAVGIYGVVAYSVAQRTHEIGVRMALGARGRDVVHEILAKGLALAAAGLALGLLGALALTRLLAGMLYGVGAEDPLTFAAVSAILAATAVIATYVPARRATRVDPIIALRCE
jgi:putative ABC transport system permease protein